MAAGWQKTLQRAIVGKSPPLAPQLQELKNRFCNTNRENFLKKFLQEVTQKREEYAADVSEYCLPVFGHICGS